MRVIEHQIIVQGATDSKRVALNRNPVQYRAIAMNVLNKPSH
jgi:hypothetical protein